MGFEYFLVYLCSYFLNQNVLYNLKKLIMEKSTSYFRQIKCILSVLFVSLFLSSYSINLISNNNITKSTKITKENKWKLYTEKNGVQIYYCTQELNDEHNGLHQEYVLLKFVNTSTEKIKIEWDEELWYDGKCLTCNSKSGEYHYSLTLSSGDSKQGNCTTDSERGLKIFSKFLNYKDKSQLSKFDLVNITVSVF